MQVIKFSHRYKKMPKDMRTTYIKDVAVVNYEELTEAEIKQDTETVDGKFYALPKTRLIWIKLWSEGKEWGTMRRWTVEKYKYYRSLVGQQVKIEIAPQEAK